MRLRRLHQRANGGQGVVLSSGDASAVQPTFSDLRGVFLLLLSVGQDEQRASQGERRLDVFTVRWEQCMALRPDVLAGVLVDDHQRLVLILREEMFEHVLFQILQQVKLDQVVVGTLVGAHLHARC